MPGQDIPINLFVEDALSEGVVRAILTQVNRGFSVGTSYVTGGFGYLKTRIKAFNHAARGMPWFVLTDLDRHHCPAALIADWLAVPKHPNLLLRVAVREVESWVMADRRAFAAFADCTADDIPSNTDQIPDAKKTLIALVAKHADHELRSAIVPGPGSTRTQGPDYNAPLVDFVQSRWRAARAARQSPSLRRTLTVLGEFQPVWKQD